MFSEDFVRGCLVVLKNDTMNKDVKWETTVDTTNWKLDIHNRDQNWDDLLLSAFQREEKDLAEINLFQNKKSAKNTSLYLKCKRYTAQIEVDYAMNQLITFDSLDYIIGFKTMVYWLGTHIRIWIFNLYENFEPRKIHLTWLSKCELEAENIQDVLKDSLYFPKVLICLILDYFARPCAYILEDTICHTRKKWASDLEPKECEVCNDEVVFTLEDDKGHISKFLPNLRLTLSEKDRSPSKVSNG